MFIINGLVLVRCYMDDLFMFMPPLRTFKLEKGRFSRTPGSRRSSLYWQLSTIETCKRIDSLTRKLLCYTLSEAWSGVNWADLMAAQGTDGTDFYDRSIVRPKHRAYYRSGRPVIKIGPKGALGSHETRPIHSAPSLGQSTTRKLLCYTYITGKTWFSQISFEKKCILSFY